MQTYIPTKYSVLFLRGGGRYGGGEGGGAEERRDDDVIGVTSTRVKPTKSQQDKTKWGRTLH